MLENLQRIGFENPGYKQPLRFFHYQINFENPVKLEFSENPVNLESSGNPGCK